jgi:hypothetical protein
MSRSCFPRDELAESILFFYERRETTNRGENKKAPDKGAFLTSVAIPLQILSKNWSG